MSQISQEIENIPGYNEAMFVWDDWAGNHIETKDPYYVTLRDGSQKRRKPPEGLIQEDKNTWHRIVEKAWTHDRCFCGCHIDLGLGMAPIVCLVPIIGPVFMYTLHARLLTLSEDLRVPIDMHAKMSANIGFDFLITLVPILGALFSWMNACSTRNAAMIDTYLRKRAVREQHELGDFTRVQVAQPPPGSRYDSSSQSRPVIADHPSSSKPAQKGNSQSRQGHQESGFM